jgi:magnesium-transporting ATPase (P-type)
MTMSQIEAYWNIPNDSLIDFLSTTSQGLSSTDAKDRLVKYGINAVDYKQKTGSLSLFLSQFKSPIIIIFLATAFLSLILQAREDALIMLYFGLLSTFFDYITFAVLLVVLNASVEQFRTAWFMESVISASAIVLIIRTRRRVYKSKPSKYLVIFTLVTILLVILIPYTPLGDIFGFVEVP